MRGGGAGERRRLVEVCEGGAGDASKKVPPDAAGMGRPPTERVREVPLVPEIEEEGRIDVPDALVERLRESAGSHLKERWGRSVFEGLCRAVAVLDAARAGMLPLPASCSRCGAPLPPQGDYYSRLAKIVGHARGAHPEMFK